MRHSRCGEDGDGLPVGCRSRYDLHRCGRERRRPGGDARPGHPGDAGALGAVRPARRRDRGRRGRRAAGRRRPVAGRPGVQAPHRRPGAAGGRRVPFSAQALSARLLAWVVGVATQRRAARRSTSASPIRRTGAPFKRDLLRPGDRDGRTARNGTSTCTEPEAAAIALRVAGPGGRGRPGRGVRPGRRHVRRRGAARARVRASGWWGAGGGRAPGRDRLRRGGVPARPVGAGRRRRSTWTTRIRRPRRAGPAAAGLRRGQGGAVLQTSTRWCRWRCRGSPGRSG